MSGQLRTAGMGTIVGLEYAPILKVGEIEGQDLVILSFFIGYFEDGLLRGVEMQKEDLDG